MKRPASVGGTARTVVESSWTFGVACSRMLSIVLGEFSTDGERDGNEVRLWSSEPGGFGVLGGPGRNEEFERCVLGFMRTVLDRCEALDSDESRRVGVTPGDSMICSARLFDHTSGPATKYRSRIVSRLMGVV